MVVGPYSAQTAIAPPEDRACRTSIRLERCPDVYRALARILATPKDPIAAVVVALECVGPRELAFFVNTSRLRPGLAVLVHGHGANDPCVLRAIESGATGIFSVGFWDSLVPAAPVEVPVTVVAQAPAEPLAELIPVVEVPVEEVVEPEEEIAEEPESPAAPAAPRVPWLRYSDAPPRTAPTLRTPPPPTPVPPPSQPPTAGDADYEPLLTDEELEALMADDISTIAPKPDPTWRRNDGLGGRS